MTTIGSDPEFQVARDGQLISALNLTQYRKYNPGNLKNGKFLADNVNLELNPVPAESPTEFANNFRLLLSEVSETFRGMQILANASAIFPESELVEPEAFLTGCDPEFDAWRQGEWVETKPLDRAIRSCGGHIHIGSDITDILGFIRKLDLVIGIPCLLVDHDDTSLVRDQLYGGAGKFRTTEYGVEYRTPSNYWTRDESLTELIGWLALSSVDMHDPASDQVRTAIDTHNRAMAMSIFERDLEPKIPVLYSQMIRHYAMTPVSPDVLSNWRI